MIRIKTILLACGVLAVSPAFGASPDPKDLAIPPQELSKARDLIRRLGSEAYRDREDAQAELAKMGRVARQPLNDAVLTDPDPEIRLRASRLLPKASADDLKSRIDTFLADTEGKYEHDLPGLKTFRKHLGGNDKSRALYVEMLKSPYNLDMLAAIDKGETEGGRVIADRRNSLWNDMQFRQVPPGSKPFVPKQPTLADIAALLYAESIVSSDNIPRTNQWAWINGTQFVQQNASIQALNTGSNVTHAEIYRTIVAKWLATRTDATELTNLSYQLGNTNLRQFKEAQTLLRRTVLTDGVQGYAKGQALNWLVQQRGKDETKFFQAIMKNEIRVGDYPDLYPNEKNPDRTVAVNNDAMIQQVFFQRNNPQGGEMHWCLMKDMALAFLITQAGGKITDYGFETMPGAVININQLGYGQYAFTSEAKRTAAFMKWGWKQVKGTDDPKKETPKETPKTEPSGEQPKDAPLNNVKPIKRPIRPRPVQPAPAPAVDLPAPAPAPDVKPQK